MKNLLLTKEDQVTLSIIVDSFSGEILDGGAPVFTGCQDCASSCSNTCDGGSNDDEGWVHP